MLPCSIYLTEQKGRIRKEMNQYSNDQGSCLTDALLNYETVRLHCTSTPHPSKSPQILPLLVIAKAEIGIWIQDGLRDQTTVNRLHPCIT